MSSDRCVEWFISTAPSTQAYPPSRSRVRNRRLSFAHHGPEGRAYVRAHRRRRTRVATARWDFDRVRWWRHSDSCAHASLDHCARERLNDADRHCNATSGPATARWGSAASVAYDYYASADDRHPIWSSTARWAPRDPRGSTARWAPWLNCDGTARCVAGHSTAGWVAAR